MELLHGSKHNLRAEEWDRNGVHSGSVSLGNGAGDSGGSKSWRVSDV